MRKCTYCGKEYPDDVNECPEDGQPLTPKPGTPPPLPPGVGMQSQASAKNGEPLATTSLILGIISLVCGPFFGIPAVICGHIAVNQARGKNGKAVAGLVTGYFGILITGLAIMAGMLLPALAKAKQKAVQIHCVSNMKQIGLAARVWAGKNDNTLPQNFLQLTNELAVAGPNVFICPADTNLHASAPGTIPVWDSHNISYEFVTPGMSLSNADKVVIVRCPIHGTELLGDGSVHIVRQPYHPTE